MVLAPFRHQFLLQKFGVLLMALACFVLVGGHWWVFQGIAWGKMVYSFSAQAPISEAVQKTFSGHYRCSLCKKIASEKASQRKGPYQSRKSNKKGKLFLEEVSENHLFGAYYRDNKFQNTLPLYYQGPKIAPPSPYPKPSYY
jgi:hypothetical protein